MFQLYSIKTTFFFLNLYFSAALVHVEAADSDEEEVEPKSFSNYNFLTTVLEVAGCDYGCSWFDQVVTIVEKEKLDSAKKVLIVTDKHR